MKKHNVYALYKGDTFLNMGTIKELSEMYGVPEKTIRHYSYSSYIKKVKKNGLILIKVEDIEEEEYELDMFGDISEFEEAKHQQIDKFSKYDIMELEDFKELRRRKILRSIQKLERRK